PLRGVDVSGDDDSGRGAEMEVPEHVALGERGEEQFLRAPPLRIAPEGGVGGAADHRLGSGTDLMVAGIRPVGGGALAAIAGPRDRQVIAVAALVCGRHRWTAQRKRTKSTLARYSSNVCASI